MKVASSSSGQGLTVTGLPQAEVTSLSLDRCVHDCWFYSVGRIGICVHLLAIPKYHIFFEWEHVLVCFYFAIFACLLVGNIYILSTILYTPPTHVYTHTRKKHTVKILLPFSFCIYLVLSHTGNHCFLKFFVYLSRGFFFFLIYPSEFMYVEAKNKDIFIYLLLTLKIDCEMQSFALVFFF